MLNGRRAVDDVAAAILDGTPVNWESAEFTSPGPDRELMPFLRVVARIADAHRAEASTARGGPAPGGAETLRQWGHLQVLERLGSGAFGDVYRAWDSRLDREVALKILDASEPASGGSPVVAEGRLLAKVRHPNVVTVYGAERVDGRVGLWMEFIRGRRLDELLREQGVWSAHEAAVAGLTVCRAVSAVHRAGLLHRDIKAQNVMREDGGRLLLMDFGTGTLLSEAADGDPATRLAGTPLYLAPELLAGGRPTVQSDIYSVGVLLFHLVSRAFPVNGRSLDDLRAAHAEGRRGFLRDLRADLPDDFVAAVERALDPDPAARHPTAGAMEDALARVVAGRRAPAARADARWIWASLAAAALVAAAAVAPRAWPDRGRASSGPALPGPPAATALPVVSSVAVRKIEMPPAVFFGRPSPDGRLFSFADEEGNLALFDLATGEIRRLTSAEKESDQHAMFSAISADGRFVAYTWWALDGRYELRVIGTDGRRPRVLLRRDEVDVPQPLEWSRDGAAVLSMLSRTDGTTALALVSVEDGRMQVVQELAAAARNASLSSDGERVVYDAPQRPSEDARDIFIVRADGSNNETLVAHPARDAAPVWTPDGRSVLFASDRSGTMDLWSVAVGGAVHGEPELVHRGLGRMWTLGVTDGGAFFYQAVVGAVEAYVAELSGDGMLGRPAPLGTSYAGSNISSVWSPDGREVAYASRRGPVGFDRRSTTLVIRNMERGQERELVPALNSFLVRSWSPDGRRVLLNGADFHGRGGAYAADVDTGDTVALLQVDRASHATDLGRGEWLPDGSRILYLDRARRALLFRDLRNGHDSVALDFRAEGIDDIAGGVLGRGYKVSPDGRTLAFSAKVREGDAWVDTLRVRTDGEAPRELLRVKHPGNVVFQDWMRDGRALLFTRRLDRASSDGIELWKTTLDGKAEPMGLSMKALRDVSIHPDGRRITFTAGAPVLEVWALENAVADRR